MTERVFDSDWLERRMAALRKKAAAYAKAQAARVKLERYRKSKKALLMQAALLDDPKASVSAQERDAYAHPEYIELLDALEAATETAERLGWELRIARDSIGAWQTIEASRRAEQRGYGA